MDVDRILSSHPEYNLRSVSRLAARDDRFAKVWLTGHDPVFHAYWRMRNQRVIIRKEFYESAFVLSRLESELARARYLVEIAAGHGLLGLFAALVHRGIHQVVHIDQRRPVSHERILELISLDYPFIKVRSRFLETKVEALTNLPPQTLLVGVHCCGPLTDHVAEMAREAGAPFAVVPCCETRRLLPQGHPPVGADLPEVLTQIRMARWETWGYDVERRALPEAVTGRGRLLVCRPRR